MVGHASELAPKPLVVVQLRVPLLSRPGGPNAEFLSLLVAQVIAMPALMLSRFLHLSRDRNVPQTWVHHLLD